MAIKTTKKKRKKRRIDNPRRTSGLTEHPCCGLNAAELSVARQKMDGLIEKETGYRPNPKHAENWVRYVTARLLAE